MKRSLLLFVLAATCSLGVFTLVQAFRPDDRPVSDSTSSLVGMATGDTAWVEEPTLVQILDSHPEFSDFRRAVEEAGLTKTLDQKGPFTLFVPSDQAFNRLPTPLEKKILTDPQESREVVKNQVVDGYLLYGASGPKTANMDMARLGYVVTEDGTQLPLKVTRHQVQVGSAHLGTANMKASNGIIHVVDEVNLPPDVR